MPLQAEYRHNNQTIFYLSKDNFEMAGQVLDDAIGTARRVWQIEPHRYARMAANGKQRPIPVDALWTDYGLRPNSNNLSFMVQSV